MYDYKTLIGELLEKVNDETTLRRVYTLLMLQMEREKTISQE